MATVSDSASRPLPRLSVVIPTLGSSPFLARCLEALRADAGESCHVVVVNHGAKPLALPPATVNQVLRPGTNLGFAAGVNLGFAACSTEYLATVNDDLVVERGWSGALLEALDSHPKAAAAQGMNFQLGAPDRVDGAGLAFNRWWQAVQRGHGEPMSEWMEGRPVGEVFGVSATAAVYRRSALQAVALPGGQLFDEALDSYYEDVDLACRLRRRGFPSVLVRRALAGHAGSATGATLGARRLELIYGNRIVVVARFLGSSFGSQLREIRERDRRDLARALLRLDLSTTRGILRGRRRARRLLGAYLHDEEGTLALEAARRFSVENQEPLEPRDLAP